MFIPLKSQDMKTGFEIWHLQLKVISINESIWNEIFFSTTVFDIDNGDLLLASSSQDSLIRVWRISQDQNEQQLSTLQSTQGKFSVNFHKLFKFNCCLETVLQGHENWVYGLNWQQPIKESMLNFLYTILFPHKLPITNCYWRWNMEKSFETAFLLNGQDDDRLGNG